MLKLQDFSTFQVSNPTRLVGGMVGKCTGSSIVSGTTYADMEWDDGSIDCGPESGVSFSNDGSSDGLIGHNFIR